MNSTLEILLGKPGGGYDWYKFVTWGLFVALIVYTVGAGLGFF